MNFQGWLSQKVWYGAVPADNPAELEECTMGDTEKGPENGLDSDFEGMLEASFKPSKAIRLGGKLDRLRCSNFSLLFR